MAEIRLPKARRGRPRQAEVARLAGVSQTTVSLVLSGNKQGIALHPDTRARVLQAARQLGYAPDPAAQRLAAARNDLLGVFSFTATFPTDVAHSYYPILVGVEQEAVARGYDLVLFTGSSSAPARAGRADALDRVRLADGCLFLGRHVPADELRRLVEQGYPAVHIGRRDELDSLAWVGADYAEATAEVVRRLAALGHRHVVLVCETDEALASTDRERGFRGALAQTGLTGEVVRAADPAAEITGEWVRSQLAAGVRAFVAEETDTCAAWRALLTAVEDAGLTAPADLSLALLGAPPADLAHLPEPTGFDVPKAELGAAAVRTLTALLTAGAADCSPLVPCEFRPGRTAGPAPHP
ncbi:LacI family DNA-binding transcriptional regulator [Streptomyces sp. TRM66268-LWL]|uniref:LacI family DNA-binding transcriptional regulator n=1 Tax=Streptomyces polyasparticus TaxID=2767826 RepID=A0ABR7SCT4_9ACTN|nr:LacI family DNA-binding transcriptional regulator [Streptomyces polyasparticus]MBC9712689.1 LacI family DNA-binding transcriptional regulator [Streptomyces polyasparticus]